MVLALDMSIIIRHLRNETIVRQNFYNAVTHGCKMVVPQMVDYEIRRGFSIAPAPKKEVSYKILIEKCLMMKMDAYSWERAIQVYTALYRSGFTIGEMDILIAAMCLENDYTLVTNNTADFKNISGLKLVDWTQG